MAKQLITYNLLHVLSSLLLVIDITQFGFNHGLSSATRNLLVFSNITVVPCIFLAFLILFKFYTSHDLWTSHGAHLVFMQDLPTVICSGEAEDTEVTHPEVTVIQEAGDIEERENS